MRGRWRRDGRLPPAYSCLRNRLSCCYRGSCRFGTDATYPATSEPRRRSMRGRARAHAASRSCHHASRYVFGVRVSGCHRRLTSARSAEPGQRPRGPGRRACDVCIQPQDCSFVVSLSRQRLLLAHRWHRVAATAPAVCGIVAAAGASWQLWRIVGAHRGGCVCPFLGGATAAAAGCWRCVHRATGWPMISDAPSMSSLLDASSSPCYMMRAHRPAL